MKIEKTTGTTKKIFAVFVAALVVYLLFIFLYEGHTHVARVNRLQTHARFLADDLWNMNPESLSARLAPIAQTERLDRISIVHENGRAFVEYVNMGYRPYPLDGALQALGLFRLSPVNAAIKRQGQTVGYLRTRYLNRNFYVYFYVGVLLAALALIGSYHVMLLERHRQLSRYFGESESARRDKAASEELYQLLADASPDMIYKLAPDGRVLFANKRAAELFGISAAEIVGKMQDELFGPEIASRHRQGIDRVIATNEPLIAERPDLEGRWLETRLFPIFDRAKNEVSVLGISRDVTARKKLEEQLRHTEKMSAIGQLAGGVAHDFNNNLTAIKGFAEILMESLDGQPELYDYAKRIYRSTERSAHLTSQLLAFSRKGRFRTIVVDVHHEIDEIIALLKHTGNKHVVFVRNFCAAPSNVVGDPGQLQNVFLNLALNAIQAMPDGGRLEFATAVVDFSEYPPHNLKPGKYVRIDIVDEGCGIPKEILSRIFEPFFTTKEAGKGTGMGLAAAYGTVQTHGGTITVESVVGSGSVFHIFLKSEEKAARSSGSSAKNRAAAAPAVIMIVDDEPDILQLGSVVLRRAGHTVLEFANPVEAVEKFRRDFAGIDLVILDMIMPEASGTEVFRKIREIDPSARIVITTGYSLKGETERLLREGVSGLLPKPFEKEQLLAVVARMLRKKPSAPSTRN